MAIPLFTPEMAIRLRNGGELPFYSGGLGVFVHGFALSARKLGVPLVVVSTLPTCGYYEQSVKYDRMEVSYRFNNYSDILEDCGNIEMPLCGSRIKINVRHLPHDAYGGVPAYFLNTDIEGNDMPTRLITRHLYGGISTGANQERKIAAALVLGRGGMMALRHLGIKAELFHLNESHTAFAAVELLREALEDRRLTGDESLRFVRERVRFTTHTPVPAGNPSYALDDATDDNGTTKGVITMGSWGQMLTREWLKGIGGNPFNMAAAAIRLAGRTNAVSARQPEVVQKMFAYLGEIPPFISITNGTSRDDWQYPEIAGAKSPQEFLAARKTLKGNLLDFLRDPATNASGDVAHLRDDRMIAVFARRFASYKRPKRILFSDIAWISDVLRSGRMQLVVAGKPHPDDHDMIDAWNYILKMSRELPNLAVLPNYNIGMSKILKGGSDLWLNFPRAPFEACGTSGMGKGMNGGLLLSTPDGWMWDERKMGYTYPVLFGSDGVSHGGVDQDAYDANDYIRAMEAEVFPMWESGDHWHDRSWATAKRCETYWTTDRMVGEYVSKLYVE